MNLQEALQQLTNGKELHRTGWNPQDGYIRLMPGMSHVWKIVLSPSPNAGNYIFSVEDLTSNDWDFYKVASPEIIEAEVEIGEAQAA